MRGRGGGGGSPSSKFRNTLIGGFMSSTNAPAEFLLVSWWVLWGPQQASQISAISLCKWFSSGFLASLASVPAGFLVSPKHPLHHPYHSRQLVGEFYWYSSRQFPAHQPQSTDCEPALSQGNPVNFSTIQWAATHLLQQGLNPRLSEHLFEDGTL